MKKIKAKNVVELCMFAVVVATIGINTINVSTKSFNNVSDSEELHNISSRYEDSKFLVEKNLYVRNNTELKPSQMTRNELLKQFAYKGTQTINITEDIISSRAQIVFERPSEICIYQFDSVCQFTEKIDTPETVVETINFKDFKYAICVKDGKFVLAKKWVPEADTNIYHINDLETTDLQIIEKGFASKKLYLAKDGGKNAPIHVFCTNGKQKEEFIFHNWSTETSIKNEDVLTTVKQNNYNYTVYVRNDKVFINISEVSASEENKE